MTLGMCTATLLRAPLGDVSADDVRETVRAAVATGCPELSVWAHHLPSAADVAALGAHVAVVEAATTWATGTAEEAEAEAHALAELAIEHGATVIAAVTLDADLPDMRHARDNLSLVVAAAERADAQVCVEFLPWTGLPTLAAAWDLVEPLGPRAGILVDTWHWQRQPGGPAPALLATIPGERIGYVQLCDAAATPRGEPFEECMVDRAVPGDGVVDFAALLDVLDAIGAEPFFATEIFNIELIHERGSAGAAAAMAAAARAVDSRFS